MHRLLDLGDGFDAVFLEVTEDSDEGGAKLRPALLKVRPVDDVSSFVAQTHAPQTPDESGRNPTDPDTSKRVKFALATLTAIAVERVRAATKLKPDRNRAELEVTAHRVEQIA